MSRRLLNQLRARSQDERGAFLILFVLLLVVLLGLSAILMDGGQARASRREAQSISDLAALGGGKSLSNGTPFQACQDAVTYLNTNAEDLSPKIVASAFCAQPGQEVGLTTCSVTGGLAQAKPTFSDGHYTVTVIYPVLDSDISDSHYGPGGAGENDGTPCDRMGVKVAIDNQTTFGKIFGTTSLETSRLAVVKAQTSTIKVVPSLWLLDPFGCTSLAASGNSHITVGDATTSPPIAGLVTIDSDGTGCGGQTTISSSNGSDIDAIPTTGTDPGKITLYAMPSGATTCSGKACNPADVSAGNISPQPTPSEERATRAPVDWKYNCKTGYPAYHGISMDDCPDTATSSPYIDNLSAAIGTSGLPSGFQQWTAAGYNCSPAGTITVSGNWWVDCAGGSGFTVSSGNSVTFNGNVVFQRDVGGAGTLNINTGNTTTSLPSACLPPTVVTPCTTSSSAAAAFVYMRNGNLTSSGVMNFKHVALIQKTGYVKYNGGGAPVWSAPTEGPLKSLALWSELSSNQYQINGGANMALEGVFFTPEAKPFTINGGAPVAQQKAQFISFQLTISGGANLTMAPDLNNFVSLPPKAGVLIR